MQCRFGLPACFSNSAECGLHLSSRQTAKNAVTADMSANMQRAPAALA
jgi:hypothetical protein